MKTLLIFVAAASVMLSLSGCMNRFGANDNPPMLVSAAEYI